MKNRDGNNFPWAHKYQMNQGVLLRAKLWVGGAWGMIWCCSSSVHDLGDCFFFLGACVVKAWHKICHFFSKTFSSPRIETLYPLSINSLFLLSPGPGNFSSTFCFWIRLSRCLIWVESQEICPFVSGLFHFVCSGFIRVVAWIITSFFYKDGWVIFHYMDKTTFCLFIHLLMGTWVASTFWLLLMLLLWTSGY